MNQLFKELVPSRNDESRASRTQRRSSRSIQVQASELSQAGRCLTFDKLFLGHSSPNTNHEEEQPCTGTLKDSSIPIAQNLPKYGEAGAASTAGGGV